MRFLPTDSLLVCIHVFLMGALWLGYSSIVADITIRLPTRLRLTMQLLCGIVCSSFLALEQRVELWKFLQYPAWPPISATAAVAVEICQSNILFSNNDDDVTDVNLDWFEALRPPKAKVASQRCSSWRWCLKTVWCVKTLLMMMLIRVWRFDWSEAPRSSQAHFEHA